MDNNIIWQDILETMRNNVSEQSINTWFGEAELIYLKDNLLKIKVPTNFIADYNNKNYSEIISDICFGLYNEKFKVTFVSGTIKNISPAGSDYQPKSFSNKITTKINPNYNFQEFVIGKNNRFAHSVSLSVAENPGSSFNPLFLYGESGMGKTHLMQAIGNFVLEEHDNKSVFYTTTEEFTNEMINAIRSNSMQKFREKYRNFDLLLIDDIHFLSKKEGTQEEFFHTFNALYEKKKQIVLTSDRPPKDIPDLEQRLVTRFEWGLLADLKSPDFETRVAILKKKAEFERIQLRDDVLEFIAEKIYSNVRALEGSLTRIFAHASYNNIDTMDITVEKAGEILMDMISDKVRKITLDMVREKVCDTYHITKTQIMDKTRKKDIAFPRQVAMYLSNLMITQLSLKEIAKYYKRKDHTTVLHAKKTIEEKFKKDKNFRVQIEKLIKDIKDI